MQTSAWTVGRTLRKALLLSLGALALTTVAITGLLAAPQPLFPYHIKHAEFELWSDEPIDQAAGLRVLGDIESRLAASLFEDIGGKRRVFIANAPWRERLFLLWNHGAAGVNYVPITRNAFLRQSDVTGDRLFGASGRPAEAPRTLSYFAAHELAHGLTWENAGALAFFRMPRWLREGLADYAAFGPGRAKDMAAALAANDPRLSPERSGYYLRYHLLVACAHENAGLTLAQLLALRLTEAEAAARWLEAETPAQNARTCRQQASPQLQPQDDSTGRKGTL